MAKLEKVEIFVDLRKQNVIKCIPDSLSQYEKILFSSGAENVRLNGVCYELDFDNAEMHNGEIPTRYLRYKII